MSGTLLKMLAISRKIMAAPGKMLAATCLMFAKNQRVPPLYLKKTVVSRNDFRTLGTNKIKN